MTNTSVTHSWMSTAALTTEILELWETQSNFSPLAEKQTECTQPPTIRTDMLSWNCSLWWLLHALNTLTASGLSILYPQLPVFFSNVAYFVNYTFATKAITWLSLLYILMTWHIRGQSIQVDRKWKREKVLRGSPHLWLIWFHENALDHGNRP